jgi:hypothetical protein
MGAFALKQLPAHGLSSGGPVSSLASRPRSNHLANPLLHLQSANGIQASEQSLVTHREYFEADQLDKGSACRAHDFAKIPLYPIVPSKGQPGSIKSEDRQRIPVAWQMDLPNDPGANTSVSPQTDNGAGVDEQQYQVSCFSPIGMTKVTSGPLHGHLPDGNTLTMFDYFPELSGKGYLKNIRNTGTFSTANHAGANVQLYGTIPSPCRPDDFSITQTVTYIANKINGVSTPKEGGSFDDIKESGRDPSKPPFRQEWLGENGYSISIADIPGYGERAKAFSSSTNIEIAKDFVTSLVGPGGSMSVDWSYRLRIEDGIVTENEIA